MVKSEEEKQLGIIHLFAVDELKNKVRRAIVFLNSFLNLPIPFKRLYWIRLHIEKGWRKKHVREQYDRKIDVLWHEPHTSCTLYTVYVQTAD